LKTDRTDFTHATLKTNASQVSNRSLSHIYKGPESKPDVKEKIDDIRKGLEITLIQPNPLIKYDLPQMVKK
jgi:hypothetical protein